MYVIRLNHTTLNTCHTFSFLLVVDRFATLPNLSRILAIPTKELNSTRQQVAKLGALGEQVARAFGSPLTAN